MNTLRTISQTIQPQTAIEGAGVRREDDLDRVRNREREIVRVDEECNRRRLSGLSQVG